MGNWYIDILSQEEIDSLHALLRVCNIEGQVNPSEFNYVEKYFNISNNFAERSQVSMHRQFFLDFKESFHPIITEDGLCYTSNMLNEQDLYTEAPELRLPKGPKQSNWTIFGYENATDLKVYPRRVFGSGISAGIQISLFTLLQDIDHACKIVNGYLVILHPPDELPKPSMNSYEIPFGSYSKISVQPKVISTTDELKKYDPLKRQCYFQEDIKLKYFKNYNMAHCKMECLAGKT